MSPIDPRPDERHITADRPGSVAPSTGITDEPPAGALPLAPTPTKPHPGFWWSVLWCIGFLLVTQVPGAILAGVILIVSGALGKSPGAITALDKQPIFSFAL